MEIGRLATCNSKDISNTSHTMASVVGSNDPDPWPQYKQSKWIILLRGLVSML